MNWDSIFHWAFAAAKDQAKKAAIAEIQNATASLNNAVNAHAGDMQAMVQEQLTKVATAAVAGILSRTH